MVKIDKRPSRNKVHLPAEPIGCRHPPTSSSELHNAYELWRKCSEGDKDACKKYTEACYGE